MKHWPLGPSSMSQYAFCTASYSLTQWLIKKRLIPKEEPDNEYAAVGTAAHAVAAKILKRKDWYDHDLFNTPEEEEYLPEYIDYIRSYVLKHPDMKIHVEQRVNPAKYVKTHLCRGTADLIGISIKEKLILVVDLKFGEHVIVDVEDNIQAILYTLGALAKLAKLGYNVQEFKIVITIVQSRAYHRDGPIREWETSYKEMMDWAKWLRKQIKIILGPNPIFSPDPEKQCRFCRCQGRCDALAEYELNIARQAFTVIEDPNAEYKEIGALTNKQISHLLDEFPGMRRWMTNVSTAALTSMENGALIPYWELKEKYSNRVWDTDPDELELHFDEEVLYEEKLRSPAQVEKLAGKGSVDDFTDRKMTGHTIVKSDNPHDADETIPFDEVI